MNGTPQDLFPGDPICAPIRTVLAETTASLVRSLSLYSMWKDHVVSNILKGVQEIRHVLQLSPEEDSIFNSVKIKSAVIQVNQGNFAEDNEDNTQVKWQTQSAIIIRTHMSFSD